MVVSLDRIKNTFQYAKFIVIKIEIPGKIRFPEIEISVIHYSIFNSVLAFHAYQIVEQQSLLESLKCRAKIEKITILFKNKNVVQK